MPARVLIIEDDPGTAAVEETLLTRAGYAAKVAYNGKTGLQFASTFAPDVILLDIELPDMSGFEICSIVANRSDAYILMVTSHTAESDILNGLGLGADDYITKPFSGPELLARVQAFLRRRDKTFGAEQADPTKTLLVGNTVLDPNAQNLSVDTRTAALTPREFQLLWFLAQTVGKLVTRAQIASKVFGQTIAPESKAIDMRMSSLRQKLAECDANLALSNIRGIGFRLDIL